jgi:hypothetical protein
MAVKLIILGLRRSGTTIFWRTFRQDRRFLAYDEPFNPFLRVLPSRAGLKAPEEFCRLLDRSPEEFWERYAPIPPDEELSEGLTPRQTEYFRWLAESGERVLMDVTRCHYKIAALAELAPRAVLVHLYRPPEATASSHLLPSATRLRNRLRRFAHRRAFWTRSGRYDSWQFESIVGRNGRTRFAERLAETGLDPDVVYAMPAVGKLLAYWRVHHERALRDGSRHFGDRFVPQKLDDFCADPHSSVSRIYERMGLSLPELDFSRVRPASGPHQPTSPRWRRYAEELGLPRV